MFRGNENDMAKAVKIAKEVKDNITHCEEWKSAYIFYNAKEAKAGESRAVCVMKDTWKAVCFAEFLGIAPEDDEVIRECRI